MKPVYCKECFAKNGGQTGSESDYGKKPSQAPYNASHSSYQPRQSYGPKPQSRENDRPSDGLSKQFELMNAKFDKLITLTETLISKSEQKPISESAVQTDSAPEAKVKKVSKKK